MPLDATKSEDEEKTPNDSIKNNPLLTPVMITFVCITTLRVSKHFSNNLPTEKRLNDLSLFSGTTKFNGQQAGFPHADRS